jgi:hypothetical protein
MTSPSPGMIVAGLDQHDVADLEAGAGHQVIVLGGPDQQLGLALGAGLAQRFGLRLAAAFGDASAKLANSTVNHSHRMIWKVKPRRGAARDEVAQEDHRGQRGDDLDHEHHRVRAERQRREEGETADDQDDADDEADEQPPVVGSVPAEGGIDFLAASEPAIAIAGTIMKKRPTNIAMPSVRL